jgi:hypothetical protein
VFTDVDKFEEVAVQSYLLAGVLEEGFVGSGGTRSNDHTIEMVLTDTLFQEGQSLLRATIEIILSMSHMWQCTCKFHHGRDIHDTTDVPTTMADEHANPGFTQH